MRRLVAIVAATAGLPLVAGCGGSGPGAAASAYLSAWNRGDLSAASLKTSDPTGAMHALSRLRTDLRVDRMTTHLGKVTTSGDTASATYTADVAIHGAGTWHYSATL